MSKNTDDRPLDNLEEVELPSKEKKSPILRYLQNPFSVTWSKLAALITDTQLLSQPEVLQNNQSEHNNPDSTQEYYFYSRFTDRVDPSLYYTILFYDKRY